MTQTTHCRRANGIPTRWLFAINFGIPFLLVLSLVENHNYENMKSDRKILLHCCLVLAALFCPTVLWCRWKGNGNTKDSKPVILKVSRKKENASTKTFSFSWHSVNVAVWLLRILPTEKTQKFLNKWRVQTTKNSFVVCRSIVWPLNKWKF